MQGHVAVLHIGDGDEGLHRRVHRLLGPESMLEHMVGGGKSGLDVAADELVLQCYVGAAPASQMSEVGECRCRLQLVMDADIGSHRLDLVENGGQFLIFDGNQSGCVFGHFGVGREHDGHRLTGETHLAVREIGWS